ncbi:heavy-metal-associated domain-containing protein [Hydrogenophaga sp. R2]|uniref:heavy-metal-associated domain-containing protein n=1 Tax=Hydrogenophaga sp. R2 TaxID=3132827 RepID=UPI003CEDCFC9
MHAFNIPTMRCGGCASRIQAALKQVDAGCEIVVDIAGRRVQVTSQATREALAAALANAGYPPGADR